MKIEERRQGYNELGDQITALAERLTQLMKGLPRDHELYYDGTQALEALQKAAAALQPGHEATSREKAQAADDWIKVAVAISKKEASERAKSAEWLATPAGQRYAHHHAALDAIGGRAPLVWSIEDPQLYERTPDERQQWLASLPEKDQKEGRDIVQQIEAELERYWTEEEAIQQEDATA